MGPFFLSSFSTNRWLPSLAQGGCVREMEEEERRRWKKRRVCETMREEECHEFFFFFERDRDKK